MNKPEAQATLRALFPELNDVQLLEAEDRLDRYAQLAHFISERCTRDGEDSLDSSLSGAPE